MIQSPLFAGGVTPPATRRQFRALTVCQPFAELIARGEKRVENRSWPTAHVGPLYIHAGKSRLHLDGQATPEGLVFGAVIARVEVVACVRLEKLRRDRSSQFDDFRWLIDDPHAFGPWCWVLENPVRVGPWPCAGKQGLWWFDAPES